MRDFEAAGVSMSGKAFIDHFSVLEDPRKAWKAWKVVYPLAGDPPRRALRDARRRRGIVEITRLSTRKLARTSPARSRT